MRKRIPHKTRAKQRPPTGAHKKEELQAYVARPAARGHKENCPCNFCIRARKKREVTAEMFQHKGKHLQYLDRLVDKKSPTFMEPQKTAVAVGLSKPPQLSATERSMLMERLRSKGIDEDAIAGKLAALFNAKKIWRHVTKGYGVGDQQVPSEILEKVDDDGQLQLATVRTLNEIRGDYPKDGNQTNVALILRVPDKPVSVEEWERQHG